MVKTGSELWNYFCILYLLGAHKEFCTFSPHKITLETLKSASRTGQGDNEKTLTWKCEKLPYQPSTCEMILPSKYGDEDVELFKADMIKCINKGKMTIVPLQLFYRDYGNPSNNALHANILIYDKTSNTVERFDPYGYTEAEFNPKELDEKIDQIFSYLTDKPVKYLSPIGYCPSKGPQVLEAISILENGIPFDNQTCTVWSLLYADTRLSNPQLSQRQVVEYLNRDIHKESRNIVDYIQKIIKIIKGMDSMSSIEEIDKYINSINLT